MYSKSVRVPSDSQAREKLALYVYEYLLHVGAQKSAQTFLSEIRWEKNITLGEPPGFLHSWWCVFWDLYCAAPERRETCEHSSEAKAFHDYVSDLLMSAAAIPSPASGNLPPGEGMPLPPGFFQQFMSPRCPGGPRAPLRMPNQTMGPGNQPLLSGMDPMRQPGHLHMNGPMQRMMPPRGMVPIGPQNMAGGMRPPLHSLMGPAMPSMTPGGGRSWINPQNANSVSALEPKPKPQPVNIHNKLLYKQFVHTLCLCFSLQIPYSSSSPGSYTGPMGSGGGAPGTPIMPSPAESTSSGDNMYSVMNSIPPNGNRPNFPVGPCGDGAMGGVAGIEAHPLNGSLASGDIDSLPKSSPGNLSMNTQPSTPRGDGEMASSFLNPFQNESYSPNMTMSV
ncbi:single-stranded DNA-binding protein 2 isoform X3 [Ictalurus furcatus]|uniref:single-stranded DNA-binding protein 2 isoform X3 n=1 Tax=Ictalurus furcatus TaxID=66913 RepID=UPI002350A108|nr:single-stranded DNA-binding protein 2 isoform X3 [Ictalurus furcatus]